MSVDLVVPRQHLSWPERHEAGEVPGRWPYGLEGLRRSTSVDLVAAPTTARVDRWLTGLRRAGGTNTGLAWDENTAVSMAAGRRYSRMYCGVIWATDRRSSMAPAARRGLRRALRQMNGVWVLSQAQLDRLDDWVGPDTQRHHVLFGVDSDFFSFADPPEQPMVFSVGGDRDRDPATTVSALTRIAAARPGTRVVLQTSSSVADPGPVEVVPRLSHRELRQFYRAASVVMVATRPNLHVSGMTVSLEAQATGRPVILTGTPGASDYVRSGETGMLTAVGDDRAMADAGIDLLDHPELATDMGRAGRRHVEDHLTTRHLCERLARATAIS